MKVGAVKTMNRPRIVRFITTPTTRSSWLFERYKEAIQKLERQLDKSILYDFKKKAPLRGLIFIQDVSYRFQLTSTIESCIA